MKNWVKNRKSYSFTLLVCMLLALRTHADNRSLYAALLYGRDYTNAKARLRAVLTDKRLWVTAAAILFGSAVWYIWQRWNLIPFPDTQGRLNPSPLPIERQQ